MRSPPFPCWVPVGGGLMWVYHTASSQQRVAGETFIRQLYKENQILVYSRVLTINHACTLLRKRHLWTEE